MSMRRGRRESDRVEERQSGNKREAAKKTDRQEKVLQGGRETDWGRK